MSRITYFTLYEGQDLSADDVTTQMLLREYDSYQVYGSTDTSVGTFRMQTSLDNTNWYDTTNLVTWTTSGDFYGQFINDNEYLRVKAIQDTSNVNLIVTARKGD